MKKQKPIGLTGTIASGKSTVCSMFESLGAQIVSGDDVAREVMAPWSIAVKALASEFGNEIVDSHGALNRKRMLEILLEVSTAMNRQLEILEPYILPEIDRQCATLLQKNPDQLLIVEAPLLFEYGKSHRFSSIIVVKLSLKEQIARLVNRSGKSKTWAEKVSNLQWPIERKIELADHIIDNNGSLNETFNQVKTLYSLLKSNWTNA